MEGDEALPFALSQLRIRRVTMPPTVRRAAPVQAVICTRRPSRALPFRERMAKFLDSAWLSPVFSFGIRNAPIPRGSGLRPFVSHDSAVVTLDLSLQMIQQAMAKITVPGVSLICRDGMYKTVINRAISAYVVWCNVLHAGKSVLQVPEKLLDTMQRFRAMCKVGTIRRRPKWVGQARVPIFRLLKKLNAMFGSGRLVKVDYISCAHKLLFRSLGRTVNNRAATYGRFVAAMVEGRRLRFVRRRRGGLVPRIKLPEIGDLGWRVWVKYKVMHPQTITEGFTLKVVDYLTPGVLSEGRGRMDKFADRVLHYFAFVANFSKLPFSLAWLTPALTQFLLLQFCAKRCGPRYINREYTDGARRVWGGVDLPNVLKFTHNERIWRDRTLALWESSWPSRKRPRGRHCAQSSEEPPSKRRKLAHPIDSLLN